MPNVFSRAAPFAGITDAPSGHAISALQLSASKLARYVGLALAIFFFVAALFILWRCLAVGIAKPLPVVVMALTAALLAGMGWLFRLTLTGRLPRTAFARIHPVVARAKTIPAEGDEPAEPAADVVQQLTLRTTAEGQELSGWLRMKLAAGQRTGTLHVAFCPPFDCPPVVEAEAVYGPECRIKVAEAMRYGVRLEVKLNAQAEEEVSVLVWFFAASTPQGRHTECA